MTANVTQTIRDLLVQGMSGVAAANAEQVQVQEKRTGAYTLFVQAARLCDGDVAPFTEVTDTLFEQIRLSGSVTDSADVAHPVNAKPGKDGKGFVIPSSFMTAKSILTDALERDLPLVDDGGERSYTAIRNDVKAIKAQEARAKAKGDDLIRLDLTDMLQSMLDKVPDLSGADLADMFRKVKRANTSRDLTQSAKAEATAEAQAEVLAKAA
jgi:hypothetical protein